MPCGDGKLNSAKCTNVYLIVPQVDETNGQPSQGPNAVIPQGKSYLSTILY